MRLRTVLLPLALLGGCGSSDDNAAPGNDGGVSDGRGSDATVVGDGAGEGAPADGTSEARVETGPPPCGDDPWVTYGHDAQRTGATNACIGGALNLAWRYVPQPPAGKKVNEVWNALAQSTGAYLAWSSQNDPYLGTSAVDSVTAAGTRAWTFNSGTDSNLGNWLTVALGFVVVNEDGIYVLDPASGMKVGGNGVDNWGQMVPDPARLYVVNTSHVDGPGIYVGAIDGTAKAVWSANMYRVCRIDVADSAGGMAVDGGVLFYAPAYSLGTGVTLPFQSGLYAFDGATGTKKWFQATTPASTISAGGGNVYLIEGGKLVARKETDGTVAWSASVAGPSAQAPVLANGLVIVGTATGVATFDAGTGAAGWTAPVVGASVPLGTIAFSGGCAGANVAQSAYVMTTMAAALGSDTLVVTASDGIHVHKLADGSLVWMGQPQDAGAPVRNPVLVGKRLYVTDGAALLALDGS